MKNSKQYLKKLCLAFSILLLSNYGYARTINVSDGGTYYICQGATDTLHLINKSGEYPEYYTDWQWGSYLNTCSSAPCAFDNYHILNIWTETLWSCNGGATAVDYATVTCNSSSSMQITVLEYECSANFIQNTSSTFWLIPVNTTISTSGATEICYGSTPTFTATCTSPNVTNWSWSVPSFMTISSGSGTSTINTNDNHHGTGDVSITVTTSEGCIVGSLGLSKSMLITSDSGTALAPVGVIAWKQAGGSCQYDASVSTVAVSYEWALNSGFSPLLETTTTPSTTGGDFDYSTAYNVWVKVHNTCNNIYGAAKEYSQTTPGKKPGCTMAPIKPDNQVVLYSDFKFYPNPANKSLSIEYPATADNALITCDMYDMVGHKLASWNLPASENKVTEDISSLQTGAYLYVVYSGTTILSRGKLMIQK
jgi:hypothetical protein